MVDIIGSVGSVNIKPSRCGKCELNFKWHVKSYVRKCHLRGMEVTGEIKTDHESQDMANRCRCKFYVKKAGQGSEMSKVIGNVNGVEWRSV